jgi:hypothetical protein
MALKDGGMTYALLDWNLSLGPVLRFEDSWPKMNESLGEREEGKPVCGEENEKLIFLLGVSHWLEAVSPSPNDRCWKRVGSGFDELFAIMESSYKAQRKK